MNEYAPDLIIAPASNIKELLEAMAADSHQTTLEPTHGIYRDGKPIGAFRLAPIVDLFWLSTKECGPAESKTVLAIIDSMQVHAGRKNYFFYCEPTSPYYKVLEEKFGMEKIELFQRTVTHVR